MGKVISFNLMTLDGFFAGPHGEIDWHRVDDEFNEFAIEQLDTVGTLLFGRVTYELMVAYWPTPAALADDPLVADRMNRLPKIVASRTLSKVAWANTTLVRENIEGEVARARQSGKDMFLFGSADLAATLSRHGLIDEYRVIINPVVLGSGQPLFKDVEERLDLRLLRTRTFRNGNVLLYYEPALQA
jgi:dihydrofolate reductase